MEFDAPTADSSPATDPADVIGSLNDTERAEWQKTGTLPVDKFTSPFADSTPAEPVEQAAPTGATPEAASEPAKPKKKGADARVEELLADRARERERADRLERLLADSVKSRTPDAKPAESSPAAVSTAVADHKRYLAMPDAPKVAEFDNYEEYQAAMSVFVADKRYEERQKVDREQRDFHAYVETQEKRVGTFTEKVKAAMEADPTFKEKILPLAGFETTELVKARNADKPPQARELLKPEHYLADEIVDSSVPDALMAHLGTNKDDLTYVLAATSPRDLARRVGEIEGLVKRAAKSAPQPKTITSAPAPPTFLGSRPAAANDSAEAAVRSGDMGAYIREMNARELAARK